MEFHIRERFAFAFDLCRKWFSYERNSLLDRSIRHFSLIDGGLQELTRFPFQGNPHHLLCDNERQAMLVSDMLPGRREHVLRILRQRRHFRSEDSGDVRDARDGGGEWDIDTLTRTPPDALAVGCWSLCGRNRVAIFDAITKSLKVFEFVWGWRTEISCWSNVAIFSRSSEKNYTRFSSLSWVAPWFIIFPCPNSLGIKLSLKGIPCIVARFNQ